MFPANFGCILCNHLFISQCSLFSNLQVCYWLYDFKNMFAYFVFLLRNAFLTPKTLLLLHMFFWEVIFFRYYNPQIFSSLCDIISNFKIWSITSPFFIFLFFTGIIASHYNLILIWSIILLWYTGTEASYIHTFL